MHPENGAEIIQDGSRTPRISRRRLLLALLALGVSACAKKVEQVATLATATPTPLPPEQPDPTSTSEPAAATSTPEPKRDPAATSEPTHTPEVIEQVNLIERLAVYAVYHGNLLDETNTPIGEVLVTRFPDHEKRGKKIWLNTQITQPCSNGHRLAPSGTLSEGNIKGDELVSDFRPRAIRVRIPTQPTTINGDYLFRAVGVCPDQDINSHFEIPQVGQGLDRLKRYATDMNRRLGVTATPEYIQKSLEAAYGGPLPAVDPSK